MVEKKQETATGWGVWSGILVTLNALILAQPALKTQAGAENPTLALIGIGLTSLAIPSLVGAVLPTILLLFKRYRTPRSWLKLFFWIQLILLLSGISQVVKQGSNSQPPAQVEQRP